MPKLSPSETRSAMELYFMEARSKLIDIAAFMDRIETKGETQDFRYQAFLDALRQLDTRPRTKNVLLALSDPTEEPIAAATTKAASGAWPGKADQTASKS